MKDDLLQEIEERFRDLENPDEATVNEAALQLGLILEANTGIEQKHGLLPGRLQPVELSDEEESNIVNRIISQIELKWKSACKTDPPGDEDRRVIGTHPHRWFRMLDCFAVSRTEPQDAESGRLRQDSTSAPG